jgi:hypothetical protein
MNKYYLDLREISSVSNAYSQSSNQIMSITGLNIGNFAFRHALRSMLSINEYEVVDYSLFNKALDDGVNPNQLLISCANWLCESEQYEKSNFFRAETIERANCSVIAFGLGAQAKYGSDTINLGKNTQRLLNIISDRSTSISVRDEFTLSILEKYGIKNGVVTGCPSNFINLNPHLGYHISKKVASLIEKSPTWGSLKTHFSEFSGGNTNSGAVLKKTLQILKESPSFYILQTPILLPYILRETESIPGVYHTNKPDCVTSTVQLESFLKSKVLHFSSIEAWLDFARTCEIAVGMRIHGNMIPLQAGVPSVVIGHDTRTAGLSRFMGVPVVTPCKFIELSSKNPSYLLDEIGSQMDGYDQRRSRIASTFVNYFLDNGIAYNDKMKQLINHN